MNKFILNDFINNIFNTSSFKDIEADSNLNYPKYNLIQTGDYTFTLEFALAGYDKENLMVKTVKNVLYVSTRKEDEYKKEEKNSEYPKYIVRGISRKRLEKSFKATEQHSIDIKDAKFENGILTIDIVLNIPEECKPKEYDIK